MNDHQQITAERGRRAADLRAAAVALLEQQSIAAGVLLDLDSDQIVAAGPKSAILYLLSNGEPTATSGDAPTDLSGAHHLEPDNIAAVIRDLRAIEDGTTEFPVEHRDWRTEAGVLARIMEHLVARIESAAAPERTGRELMDIWNAGAKEVDKTERLQKACDIMRQALCEISQPADEGRSHKADADDMRETAIDALSEAESVIDFGETVPERAASPATASGDELPPLPEAFGTMENADEEGHTVGWVPGYTADQMRGYAIAARAAVSAATKPLEMALCETEHLGLRANQPYVFRVHAGCASCERLHAMYSESELAKAAIPVGKISATKQTADLAHLEGLADLFGAIAAKHGIEDISVNKGAADELFPHVLAEFIVAASRGAEPDHTFEHLAGRGLHELRTDELPAYLASVAHNFGARSTEFSTAAQWVAAEIERKTNDERILAVKLADVQSLLATKPAGVPTGYVLMPRRLTAENGAKSLFIGEFKESVELTCPDCEEAGEVCDDCETCGGSGTVSQPVTVEWDTIKRIYALAVEKLAAPTAAPADQVRNEALEEAALAAEKVQDDYREHQSYRWPEMRDDAETGAAACVTAIRALKSAATQTTEGAGDGQ